ncbi:hypothetical protein BH23GEM4_BH23GEM4_23890 [soil metagenome]
MCTVDEIEYAVRQLSRVELSRFRTWFLAFDAAVRDREPKQDVAAVHLDAREEAVSDLRAGRTRRPLERLVRELPALLDSLPPLDEADAAALAEDIEQARSTGTP